MSEPTSHGSENTPAANLPPGSAQLPRAPPVGGGTAGASESGGGSQDVDMGTGGSDSVGGGAGVAQSGGNSSSSGSGGGQGSAQPPRQGSPSDTSEEAKGDSILAIGNNQGAPISSRVLSLARAADFIATRTFPPELTAHLSSGTAAPARWEVPPRYRQGDSSYFVGVPAWSHHDRVQKFTRDGFAGLEVLYEVEGFSATDLADLAGLVSRNEDVEEFFLRPRSGRLPDVYELETMLGSLYVKREMASILMHYEPRGLAQRVFSMTTFMRRLLEQNRRLQRLVDSSGSTAVQETYAAHCERDSILRDYALLHAYYESQVQDIQRSADVERRRHCEDTLRQLREHEIERQVLRDQVDTANTQLAEALHRVTSLESQLQSHSLDVGEVMNFLNQGKTRVTNNWGRLESLLRHFKAGTTPDPEWQTIISVTSLDDPFSTFPAFTPLSKDPGGPGAAPSGSGGQPPRSSFAQGGPSPGASPAKQLGSQAGRQGSSAKSARRVPDQIQWRPSGWGPGVEAARAPDETYILSEAQACASLANLPVVWRKLRDDVKYVMLSGMGYPGAMELLSSGDAVHTMFHPEDLAQMLLSMMFWNKLDDTAWTRHVPRNYFLRAEVLLNDLDRGGCPPYWPSLDEKTPDPELQGTVDTSGSEEDNETRDETYNPKEDAAETPRGKRRRDRSHSEGSASKASKISSSSKPVRAGRLRKQSPLARKEYVDLSPSELMVVEVPGPGVVSWRHEGILMTFSPATTHAVQQSSGFPDYVPNKHGGVQHLKERWDLQEYEALVETEPWVAMFTAREQELLFHNRSDLNRAARKWMDGFVQFMQENAEAFWNAGHWFTIDTSTRAGAQLQRDRKKLHDSVSKAVAAKKERLLETGAPPTLLDEPGIWTFPAKVCTFVVKSPESKKANGDSFSWVEQVQTTDQAEPARVQWTCCSTVEERIAHLPESTRRMLLPAEDRQDNPVSLEI